MTILSSPFMQQALDEAEKAFSQEEVPIGVVIVNASQEVIVSAHNQMETRNDPTAHAEMLAIQQACAIQQSSRLEECDMYVTLEPCPMCATAIAFARIRRLYIAAEDPKGGGVLHGPRIFESSSCHHRPEIISGIQEKEASRLLKQFFATKR